MINQHKFAFVVWVLVYIVILTLQLMLAPLLVGKSVYLKTLITTGLCVPIVIYILLPLCQKILGDWMKK